MSVFVLIANRLLIGLIVSHFHVAGRALMGQSTDPGIQHLKQTIALLRRFEEALLDVFSEEIAAARRSGDLASASQAEEFICQLRVDLLKQRALSAANDLPE